jgi:hypothetical protein
MKCSFGPCNRSSVTHGLCATHDRQRKEGKELTVIRSWVSQSARNQNGEKQCRSCLAWLPVAQFSKNARHSDGLTYKCRRCAVDDHRLRAYGVTAAQYDALSAKQGGKCAICGSGSQLSRELAVDHNHECCPAGASCGECVRGLLCSRCNTGIGLFGDSPRLLLLAMEYLTNA